jgi:hypothetical protein
VKEPKADCSLPYICVPRRSCHHVFSCSQILWFLAACLWLVATAAIPGYITHYCHSLDAREVFNPIRALRRASEGGRRYSITLAALSFSFVGLLVFGIGFLVTSVWFWQVAGFSFATAFTGKFGLQVAASKSLLASGAEPSAPA